MNGDVHGDHASCGSVTRASRFLIGLVTCFATHDGIPADETDLGESPAAAAATGGSVPGSDRGHAA